MYYIIKLRGQLYCCHFQILFWFFKTEKRFKDNHEIAVLFFIFIGDKKDETYLPEGHAVKEPFRK